MKIPISVGAVALLIIGSKVSVYAQESSFPDSSEEATLNHALTSSVNSRQKTDYNTGLYEEAMQLLGSLPKFPGTTKKPKLPSNGIFQNQLQRLSTFVYRKLFSPEAHTKRPQEKPMSATLQKATSLLEEEARRGNPDAQFQLAELNFFSYYGHPRNYKAAFDYYSQLASEKGNSTAQRMIGFMYATGVGNVVERDLGKALLYTTFASFDSDTVSQMMLGFRHYRGIGTPESCQKALQYYKEVADKAMMHYRSGPPGGRVLPLPKIRLPDEYGGIFGYNQNGARLHDQSEIEDILQFQRQLAESGDINAQYHLGLIYYHGSHSIPQNFKKALKYFKDAASHMYSNNRKKIVRDPQVAMDAAKACGMLGEMHRRGEAVDQDYTAANAWYTVGAAQNDPVSLNGLGVMHLEGIVVAKDVKKAYEYFQRAIGTQKRKNPEALFNLGLLSLNSLKPNYDSAYYYFVLASREKYLPAAYHLAEMHRQGQVGSSSCAEAVAYYKSVAERGDWEYSPFPQAHAAYKRGDVESALLWYLLGAEMGYEVGQTNVAWLLDEDRYELLEVSPNLVHQDSPLVYWTRSANQGHSDARVKMGDYYFYGIGTNVDLEKAAKCYESADSSGLGMWNMGWMYEHGIGVAKDFHLAKRSYDRSLVADPEAYLPVTLSLLKLNLKFLWGYLTGEVDIAYQPSPQTTAQSDDPDSPLNPSQDPSSKRFEQIDAEIGQWERGQQEEDTEFDPAEGHQEDESSLVEDLIILALCVLVGWMVYVRQFRAGGPNANPPIQPQFRPQQQMNF